MRWTSYLLVFIIIISLRYDDVNILLVLYIIYMHMYICKYLYKYNMPCTAIYVLMKVTYVHVHMYKLLIRYVYSI